MRVAKTNTSGFTIVELLIVIVVIGILAAITVVAFNGIQNRANDTAIQSDFRSVASKIEAYKAINGAYPTVAQMTNGDAGIKLTRTAYDTGVHNVYYCQPVNQDIYSLNAQSKSGKRYVISSLNKSVAESTVTNWISGGICPTTTGTSDSTYALGYQLAGDGWRAWTAN